tara:strand:- start:25 stop:1632 length:1608 start_codon:yes stop_codon:yes gene_type:complete
MMWIMKIVFPLATKLGDWLGGMSTTGTAAALVTGYVGFKAAGLVLDKAGNAIATAVGNFIPTETIGKGIAAAFGGAKGILQEWADSAAGFLFEAMDPENWKTWWTTIGDGIQATFGTVSKKVSDWYGAVGTGISNALTNVKMSKWYTNVATGIGTAFGNVKGVFGNIGTAIAGGISTAATKLGVAGKAIGDKAAGAFGAIKGLGKMGGLIGAGIGVVAIGGAIGYHMWKKYKEYEEGRDVTTGLSDIQLMRRLRDEFGIGQEAAAGLVPAMRGDEEGRTQIAIDRESVARMSVVMRDVVESFVAFDGKIDKQTLGDFASMFKGQQDVFKGLLDSGAYDVQNAAQLLRILEGVTDSAETIASRSITGQADVGAIYAQRGVMTNAMMGPGAWSSSLMSGNMQERWMREQLAFVYGEGEDRRAGMPDFLDKNYKSWDTLTGVSPWQNEITSRQAEMGYWMAAAQGDVGTGMFSAEGMKQLGLGEDYTKADITRLANNINFSFVMDGNTMSVSPAEAARIKNWIDQGWQFTGITAGGPD